MLKGPHQSPFASPYIFAVPALPSLLSLKKGPLFPLALPGWPAPSARCLGSFGIPSPPWSTIACCLTSPDRSSSFDPLSDPPRPPNLWLSHLSHVTGFPVSLPQ